MPNVRRLISVLHDKTIKRVDRTKSLGLTIDAQLSRSWGPFLEGPETFRVHFG